jgi:hypothetical protein
MTYFLKITPLLLSCLCMLTACHETPKKKKKDFLLDQKLPDAVKIKRLLTNGHPELPLHSKERQALYGFYQKIDFKPVFSGTPKENTIQKNWIQTIAKHRYFGLPSARIISLEKRPDLIKELLIHYQIGTIVHDLDSGFIDFKNQTFKNKKWKEVPLDWISNTTNTDSLLLTCGPSDTNYRYFAQHLYNFCDSTQLDTLAHEISTEKENKSLAWNQLQSALIDLGYCNENTDSLGIRAALRKYQKNQKLLSDGHIGPATALAFGESKTDKLYLAQISLDKVRQSLHKPSTFVAINLPSFELQFFSKDTLRSTHRVIIGKIAHPSPTLQSKIYQIITLPYWRVPSSIAKNEILPALKRNYAYLQEQHMRIYGKEKKEIDPQKVNWKKIKNQTFPYVIEQDPGPWNSLGLIKFNFSNEFSVYVHDTPSRGLFGNNFRSFSHGCMRAQYPIELGQIILNQDCLGQKCNEVNGDSLQKLIDEERHQKIQLLKPIPIFVEYYTVTADRKGLYFHLDLYQKDRKILDLFRSGNYG